MPSRGCEGDIEVCLDELFGIIESREGDSFNVVCGDMNGDMGILGGPKGKKSVDPRGSAVSQFAQACDLYAANLQLDSEGPRDTFFGPHGSSCIDYILIPKDLARIAHHCRTWEHETLNTSDHVPVSISLQIDGVDKCFTATAKTSRLKWEKLSKEELYEKYTIPVSIKLRELEDLIDRERPSPALIDGAFDTICNILHQAEKVIPKSRFKSNLKPFWCPRLTHLKNEKVRLHRVWKTEGCPRERNHPALCAYEIAEKTFRKALKAISKSYDDEKIIHASYAAILDKNVFWRLLKRNKKNSGKSPGHDLITAEHLRAAGTSLPSLLVKLFRMIFEYRVYTTELQMWYPNSTS